VSWKVCRVQKTDEAWKRSYYPCNPRWCL